VCTTPATVIEVSVVRCCLGIRSMVADAFMQRFARLGLENCSELRKDMVHISMVWLTKQTFCNCDRLRLVIRPVKFVRLLQANSWTDFGHTALRTRTTHRALCLGR